LCRLSAEGEIGDQAGSIYGLAAFYYVIIFRRGCQKVKNIRNE